MTEVIGSPNERSAIIQRYQGRPVRYAPGRLGRVADITPDFRLIIRREATRDGERTYVYLDKDTPGLEVLY